MPLPLTATLPLVAMVDLGKRAGDYATAAPNGIVGPPCPRQLPTPALSVSIRSLGEIGELRRQFAGFVAQGLFP
jgi:hypothetical protein